MIPELPENVIKGIEDIFEGRSASAKELDEALFGDDEEGDSR